MSQTELWHRDDYRVFNDQILPEIMRFLKQNPKDHEDFSFSFNYRAQLKSGQYRSLLQRSTYFIDQKTGLPLIAVGSVFDISHYKDDNRIIFTIEKTERNFTAITKTPVVKKIYYTDKDYDVLTNRELEILSSMQEGLTSKAIAKKLSISIHTVNIHRGKILKKTNCRNIAELFNYLAKGGLIANENERIEIRA